MGLLNGILHSETSHPFLHDNAGDDVRWPGAYTWLSNGMNLPIIDPMITPARGNAGPVPNLTFFGIAMFLVALFIERYPRFGRYILAIGGAEDRAKLAGIPIDKYKIMAFTLAGLFIGVAGVLNSARIGAGTSTAGQNQPFAAITAVVVGGTASTGEPSGWRKPWSAC